MAHNYSGLTGDTLVEAIRTNNKKKKTLCIFGIGGSAIGLICGLLLIKFQQQYFYGILLAVLMAVLAYGCFTGIASANKTIADPLRCDLFRKFGTPDMIAQRIAQESSAPLLDAKGALICDSFVMKHGDFESFVPLEEALWVYREEHRTNGIPDGVFLIIFDSYGCKNSFPFQFGKTGKEIMTDIMKHISEKAPECAFGYSTEAQQYMLAHKKVLQSE